MDLLKVAYERPELSPSDYSFVLVIGFQCHDVVGSS